MAAEPASPILITGVAGFIGRAVAERLLQLGRSVVGVDDLSGRPTAALQQARLATVTAFPGFRLIEADISEPERIATILRTYGIRHVIHLAARTGVRDSMDQPFAYQQANIAGHLAMLDACRTVPDLAHFVYASSSSVYGDRPIDAGGFREQDLLGRPTSLYAATKLAAELLSDSYAHAHGFPQTGLRLFTAYGPWGRPDMSYWRFTRAMLAGDPIEVFGHGQMARDFTFIDDIVSAIIAVLQQPPARGEHRLLNVGSGQPVTLPAMIETLENIIGRKADQILQPRQAGEVTATRADISALYALTGLRPRTALAEGLQQFVAWYRDFYSNG